MTIETEQKPWADLTKEEKSARIKEGKARAAAEREAKPRRAPRTPEPKEAEDIESRRARLLQELAEISDFRTVTPTSVPGSLVKDGMGLDKTPWTAQKIREFCNNNIFLCDNNHPSRTRPCSECGTNEGVPFVWRTLMSDPAIISVTWNGIAYWLWPGQENKIPSVHYAVYMQMLEDRRRESGRWRAPVSPGVGNLDGYNSAEAHAGEIGSASNLGHVMGVGPLEPRGE